MENLKMAGRLSTTASPGDQGIEQRITSVVPGYEQGVPDGCIIMRSDGVKPWDNPDDLINHETEFWITNILGVTVSPLLFLFGFPANILNLAVFYRQGLRERINLCLFVLSFADVVALTAQFLLSTEMMYRNLFNVQSGFFLQYTVGFTGFMWVSQFLTCVMACERCFCVFSPFKAQKYLKTSTMAVLIVVTSVFLVGGITLIAGYKLTFVCVFDPLTNQTGSANGFTSFYLDNREVFDIIDIWIYSVLFTIILLFVTIVATVLTIIKLHQAAQWRQQNGAGSTKTNREMTEKTTESSRLSSKEEAITKMLVASSVLFIFCFSPVVIVQIASFLVDDLNFSGRYYNVVSVLWRIISQLRLINCSMNFIIYYRMGSRFRAALRETLRCRKD